MPSSALGRFKPFVDKAQITVDKLETQYLTKISTGPFPNTLLLQLTKQHFQSPNQIAEDASAQNNLNKRFETLLR